jgi:DNA-binding response OmpR family regulator
MKKPADGAAHEVPEEVAARKRKLVMVVSSDREFAESLRSHLAGEFDVLVARNAGEAAAKAQAVRTDLAVVDLGAPLLGISALGRMRELHPAPVICALALPEVPAAHSQFDFDYVLARPATGADLPERIRFIVAKAKRKTSR